MPRPAYFPVHVGSCVGPAGSAKGRGVINQHEEKSMYQSYENLTDERNYDKRASAWFLTVDGEWGVFSNMHRAVEGIGKTGYDKAILRVCGKEWTTTEAIYQAMRFPEHPDIQETIRTRSSPMIAKMVAVGARANGRPDWFEVKPFVMEWCLRIKVSQWWRHVHHLLLKSDPLPIVEVSKKDTFWGAKEQVGGRGRAFAGRNVLGRLWMGIRAEMLGCEAGTRKARFAAVPLPPVPNMRLFGQVLA